MKPLWLWLSLITVSFIPFWLIRVAFFTIGWMSLNNLQISIICYIRQYMIFSFYSIAELFKYFMWKIVPSGVEINWQILSFNPHSIFPSSFSNFLSLFEIIIKFIHTCFFFVFALWINVLTFSGFLRLVWIWTIFP